MTSHSLYGRKTEFAVMMRTGMVASSILTVNSKILILIPNFDICFCIISTKETHKSGPNFDFFLVLWQGWLKIDFSFFKQISNERITINVPVVYMGRYEVVLRGDYPKLGAF
jgi:hypothetical protein